MRNDSKKNVFYVQYLLFCAQMTAYMPDRLPEVANVILV